MFNLTIAELELSTENIVEMQEHQTFLRFPLEHDKTER